MNKRTVMFAALLVLTTLLLAACGPGPTATPVPTPPPTPTPTPTKPPPNYVSDKFKDALSTVKSVCLDTSKVESRGYTFNKYNSVDFLRQALKANRIEAKASGTDCDASLVVEARFTGVEKGYSSTGGTVWCYGAAKSTGTWVLALTDGSQPPVTLTMDATYDPGQISNCAKQETEAPLDNAWIKAVVANLQRVGWLAMPSGWTIPK